jgi:hypothetical protein
MQPFPNMLQWSNCGSDVLYAVCAAAMWRNNRQAIFCAVRAEVLNSGQVNNLVSWTNIWPWVPAGPGARIERAGWLPAVSFCFCFCFCFHQTVYITKLCRRQAEVILNLVSRTNVLRCSVLIQAGATATVTEAFRVFPQSFQANARIVPLSGYTLCLPNHFPTLWRCNVSMLKRLINIPSKERQIIDMQQRTAMLLSVLRMCFLRGRWRGVIKGQWRFRVSSRVEAGSNTSTVALRVVGGNKKGSLESGTVKHSRESHGTRTAEWMRWRGSAAIVNDGLILSDERMLYKHYDRRCSIEKKNSGRESQGARRQDEPIGGIPPVVK